MQFKLERTVCSFADWSVWNVYLCLESNVAYSSTVEIVEHTHQIIQIAIVRAQKIAVQYC